MINLLSKGTRVRWSSELFWLKKVVPTSKKFEKSYTRHFHKIGPPWICGKQNVSATARDNTERGHRPCLRIEIKIPDPTGNHPGRQVGRQRFYRPHQSKWILWISLRNSETGFVFSEKIIKCAEHDIEIFSPHYNDANIDTGTYWLMMRNLHKYSSSSS